MCSTGGTWARSTWNVVVRPNKSDNSGFAQVPKMFSPSLTLFLWSWRFLLSKRLGLDIYDSRTLEVLQVTVKRKIQEHMRLWLQNVSVLNRNAVHEFMWNKPHSWNYLLMSEWDGIWNSAGVLPCVSVLLPKGTRLPWTFGNTYFYWFLL